MNIFTLHIEDTNLAHRTDLLDWICSPQIARGKQHEKYWIIKTETPLGNPHGDVDVFNFMKLLQQVLQAGYKSLIIMKHGIHRAADSRSSEQESSDRQEELQQTDTTPTGEIPDGESRSEILAGSGQSEHNQNPS
jgi:hypothetical protein